MDHFRMDHINKFYDLNKSARSLGNLPWELVVQVASNPIFSTQDWKILRLVCLRWEQPVASLLFRRITISRFKADKEKFEKIAIHGDLAGHVLEVVWHELSLESWGGVSVYDDREFSQTTQAYMYKASCDTDVFWIPDRRSDPRTDITQASLPLFISALNRMPKLRSFTSCPMPPGRVFSYRGFDLEVDSYMNQYDPERDPKFTSGNMGLFRFILPLLMDGRYSKINTLRWQDEGTIASLTLDLPDFSGAFRNLEIMSLTLSHFDESSTETLISCLSAATKLRRLSLRLEERRDRSQDHLRNSIFKNCFWPHLRYLHLKEVVFGSDNFEHFLWRHSRTLESIVCSNCRRTDYGDALGWESIRLPSSNSTLAFLMSESNGPIYIGPKHKECWLEFRTLPFEYNHPGWSEEEDLDWTSEGYNSADDESASRVAETSDDEERSFKDYQPKVFWSWDRFRTEDDSSEMSTYYWQVADARNAKAETTCWEFKKNGERSLSSDPFDYFSDWDSDEDTAVPTPYCKQLHDFSMEDVEEQAESSTQNPPEGAELYDPENHPWILSRKWYGGYVDE
ncbi:hypothetical protein M426DRAFT_15872 [Hypoxylon sp. CI-4A]|nr:hypothetical protein M426DRAFT_15872 [Hypoxylon sp. CI-4A]